MLESRALGWCGCCCRRICAGHVSLSGPLQPEPFAFQDQSRSLVNELRINGTSKNLIFNSHMHTLKN